MRVPNSISGIGQDVPRENRRHRGGATHRAAHGPATAATGPPTGPPGGTLASANRTASAPA